MLQPVKCSTIHELDDGRVGVAVDRAIRAAAMDCVDRPGLSAARTVTLKLEITPEGTAEGVCTSCSVESVISSTLPAKRSSAMNARVAGNGQLQWNNLSPDDAGQSTLDEA